MLNSYDQFIEDYGTDILSEIKRYKSIDEDSVVEEDLEKAEDKINNIYDTGVAGFFADGLFNKDSVTLSSVADLGLHNMNRYGTEMRQALNALQDFNNSLRKYIQEDEDEE